MSDPSDSEVLKYIPLESLQYWQKHYQEKVDSMRQSMNHPDFFSWPKKHPEHVFHPFDYMHAVQHLEDLKHAVAEAQRGKKA